MTPLWTPSADELRRTVPVEAALNHFGVMVDSEGKSLCPFHSDREHPNLVCLPPSTEYPFYGYFCNACGARGDAILLVMKLGAMSYGAATALVARMDYEAVPSQARRSRPYVPDQAWEDRLVECQERAKAHRSTGLLGYGARFDPDPLLDEFLIAEWGWGLTESADVVIPHRDQSGKLTAVKTRKRTKEWHCYGTLPTLYGAWKRKRATRVLICEGESDAVWSAFQRIENLDVRAIPAASVWRDSFSDEVAEYEEVITGFDNDTAGQIATARWRKQIATVRWLDLPMKTDLRGSGLKLDQLLLH